MHFTTKKDNKSSNNSSNDITKTKLKKYNELIDKMKEAIEHRNNILNTYPVHSITNIGNMHEILQIVENKRNLKKY